MTYTELVQMARIYARDTNSYVFTESQIKMFINQAIDRVKHFDKAFFGMKKLVNGNDIPNILPEEYHYLLAIFAASRLFDIDERHYEGVEKRNEFETTMMDLLAEVNAGNIELFDTDGYGNPVAIDSGSIYTDYVKDDYFKRRSEGEL